MAASGGATPQVLRSVYHVGAVSQPIPNAPIANITPRFDKKSGEYILLWNDILRIFKDAQYVLRGTEVINFMVNDDFEEYVDYRGGALRLAVVLVEERDFQKKTLMHHR